MASDFRSLDSFPAIKKVAINGTTSVEIIIPNDCNQVTLKSESHKFFLGQNDQSDATALTNDNYPVSQNESISFRIGRGRNRARSFFVQSHSSSDNIFVMMEEI